MNDTQTTRQTPKRLRPVQGRQAVPISPQHTAYLALVWKGGSQGAHIDDISEDMKPIPSGEIQSDLHDRGSIKNVVGESRRAGKREVIPTLETITEEGAIELSEAVDRCYPIVKEYLAGKGKKDDEKVSHYKTIMQIIEPIHNAQNEADKA